jgi:enamine deaminase RidA (YjgF/YER057c/UK114 family)
MTPEERLKSMGFELKEQSSFHPAVAMGKITGNLLYLSGATPPPVDGVAWDGRVGDVYTVEQGYEAAKQVAFMQLQMAWNILGDLSRIKQTIKVLGMVNCSAEFRDTPAVMHGFSETIYEVLGEAGKHARSAVGVQALPGNVPVEVETIFEIE